MKPGDPVSEGAARAIAHLNEDHDDALLDMARAIGGPEGLRKATVKLAHRARRRLTA